VFNECKINENFIGADPWELDFTEDEEEDIKRLAGERKHRLETKKLELEENKLTREALQDRNKLYTYVGIAVFILILILILTLK